MKYRKGYKYQLAEDEVFIVPIHQPPIQTQFINLIDGVLKIKSGYAWDGPSGPTIDTKNSMRGSLVHDALYQLMRQKHLGKDAYRGIADWELYEVLVADKMWKWRARGWYKGVRKCAGPAADPKNKKKVYEAP